MTDKKTTKRTADEMEHQDGRSDTVKAQCAAGIKDDDDFFSDGSCEGLPVTVESPQIDSEALRDALETVGKATKDERVGHLLETLQDVVLSTSGYLETHQLRLEYLSEFTEEATNIVRRLTLGMTAPDVSIAGPTVLESCDGAAALQDMHMSEADIAAKLKTAKADDCDEFYDWIEGLTQSACVVQTNADNISFII